MTFTLSSDAGVSNITSNTFTINPKPLTISVPQISLDVNDSFVIGLSTLSTGYIPTTPSNFISLINAHFM